MSEKLLIQELYRIREMMGIKTNSNNLIKEVRQILNEGGDPTDLGKAFKKMSGLADEALSVFAKSEDELTSFVDDIVKASRKGNWTNFIDDVITSTGKNIDEIDEAILEKYIKNNPDLLKIVDDYALKIAKDVYEKEIKTITNLTNILDNGADDLVKRGVLSDQEADVVRNLPSTVETYMSKPITATNASSTKRTLEAQDELLSKIQPQSEEVIKLRQSIKIKINQADEQILRTKEELADMASKREAEELEKLRQKGLEDDAVDLIDGSKSFDDIADEAVDAACAKNPKICKGIDLDVLKGDLAAWLRKISDDAGKMQKVWDSYGPTEKLTRIKRLIQNIENNKADIDKKGGKGTADWLLSFFKKTGKNAEEASKINWWKIYKVVGIGYLVVCAGFVPDYERLDTHLVSELVKTLGGLATCAGKALLWPGTLIHDSITGIYRKFTSVENTPEGFDEWFEGQKEEGKYPDLNVDDRGWDEEQQYYTLVGPAPDLLLYEFKYNEDKQTFEEVE